MNILCTFHISVSRVCYSLEQTAAGIGLHVNAHKTEYMCFNQTGNISTLSGSVLKVINKFTYLGSSVSSTETDMNTRLAKAWTAIYGLSVIWKSDLTDKMKCSFFPVAIVPEEMDTLTRFQILYEVVCISYIANTLWENMNKIILCLAMRGF